MPSTIYTGCTHKTPSGPKEVQQGSGVSSSGYGPLSVLQGARTPPAKSCHRDIGKYAYGSNWFLMPSTICRDRAHKAPSGPEEVQQGPRVSSSDYGPLSVLRSARRPQQGIAPARHPVDPKKSNWVLEMPALITGLCQFYRVPVAPSKVSRSPTNRAFIKKYCAPRQAQGETPQQPGDGRQQTHHHHL